MRSSAELTEAFRASGLKVTPQRQLIFRLLDGNTGHPTADRLFAEASDLMPGISLRTAIDQDPMYAATTTLKAL